MNYEDEPYARAYTRDTLNWKLLGWEGQTVLLHMLRDKFDRSGVLDLECHDPSHAVTAITGLPLYVTEPGVAALLHQKTWVVNDGKLVWPNYVRAQTCRRSDKARQQESRQNRSRDALLPESQPVTRKRAPVTERHTLSQPVTPSRAEPSSTEQSRSRARPSRAPNGGVDPNLTEIAREKPPAPPPSGTPRGFGVPPSPRRDLLFAKIQAQDYEPTGEHRAYALEVGLEADELDQVLIELRDKHSVPRGQLPPTGHDLPWWDDKMNSFIRGRAQAKAARLARSVVPKPLVGIELAKAELERVQGVEHRTVTVMGVAVGAEQ